MKMKGLTADGHWLSERRREEGALSFLLLFLLSLKLSLNSLVDVIVFVNRRACSRVCLARPTVSFVLYRPNDSISGRDRVTRLTVPVCVCLHSAVHPLLFCCCCCCCILPVCLPVCECVCVCASCNRHRLCSTRVAQWTTRSQQGSTTLL